MLAARVTALRSDVHSSPCRSGFSLLELVITIALLGVIAGVGVSLLTDDSDSARVAKLQSDVNTLNQMVALYVADGGSLAGLSTPQTVLDKLKRSRPQSEWQQHVGIVSGRLLDVRLRALMTSQPDNSNNPRAFWDRTKQRFIIRKAAGSAVSDFYLDETLATADYGTEKRTKSVVTFNSNKSGWVWGTSTSNPAAGYLDPQPFTPPTPTTGFNPNETADASSGPPPDSGGGSGGGGGGGGGSPAQPTLAFLPVPVISPAGGTFAFSNFPTSVTITSGGPPEVSMLMYSINGGAWQEYAGTSIPLMPAMTLQAYNLSTRPAEYATSFTNSQSYYRLTSGFSGSGEGSWGNALGGSNLVTNIQNSSTTSTIKSGNTKLDLGNGTYLDAGVENSLSFTPASFDKITPNTWFDFGALMILNGTTFYNSEATGVTLTVNLNLTQPTISATTYINLGLVSTPNTSDRLASADIVQLINPTTDFTITIDGVQYRLELEWVSKDPAASVVQGSNLLVYESANAAVELRARFTSNF
ncbi:choice-of-anchor K domain-containing protein [Prosthecobacter sp.]|uniref:choice-of-anchor K domain-containing protein n=1 Tax=Prosthecobacter sp. TaxID=1965333 RepID=UPI0037842E58